MMVVVAMISNISTGAMFLAGIVPGFLTTSTLLMSAYAHARRGGPQYRETQPFTLARLGRTTWAALPAMGMPVVIIGGIIGGVFTPTEAAAVAGLYGVIIAVGVYRELPLKAFPNLILRTVSLSAAVMTIIATASIFAWLIGNANVPEKIANFMLSLSDEPWVFLITVNVTLMVIGMFMESIAAILILVPVLMPIAEQFGIHPIHFGLVVVMNFAIGMVTPPYGISLFVSSSIAERSVVQVSRRILLPWLAMTVILLLITFVPPLGLYLPRLAGFIG